VADLAKLLHARADRSRPILAERAKMRPHRPVRWRRRSAISRRRRARLEAILEIAPAIGDRATSDGHPRLHARAGGAPRTGRACGRLRREAEHAPREAREEMLMRIGQIQETRMRVRGATFATYASVSRRTRTAPPGVAGLERLLTGGLDKASRSRAWRCPITSAPTTPCASPRRSRPLLPVTDAPAERRARLEKLRGLLRRAVKNLGAAYTTRSRSSRTTRPIAPTAIS